jgi:hypothetical protein
LAFIFLLELEYIGITSYEHDKELRIIQRPC